MKNIDAILKETGIEVPDEQKEAFKKAFNENYKTINEFQKLVTDRDHYKEQAESAEESLKTFEGVDPEKMKQEIDDWKKKAEDAKKEYEAKLYERDFNDALSEELSSIKFSSAAAKKSVEADIRQADLKLKDGKILGLSDLIDQMKKEDASAFVDEDPQKAKTPPKFTEPMNNTPPKGSQKLSGMSLDEQIALKKKDPDLYHSMLNDK